MNFFISPNHFLRERVPQKKRPLARNSRQGEGYYCSSESHHSARIKNGPCKVLSTKVPVAVAGAYVPDDI